MKKIIIVRHAKSSWEHPGLKDIERPLNERGLRDAPKMGQRLYDLGIRPDLLVSSPARRTWHTAQFFAQALQYNDNIQSVPQLYIARPEDILELIRELDPVLNEVIIFGHNPTLTDLINYFAETHISNVPTCGIGVLEAEVDDWQAFVPATARLRHFLYPKMFVN